MIERLKTREEDKLRTRRERGSPERGIISSTIEDRRQRRRRRCLVDEELGNRREDDAKTSVCYDQRFDDFSKSNRGEETREDRRRSRSIEKVSRYELGRARSNDANGFRELDERIPRYMLREAESHVREEMSGLNVDDNIRRVEGRRAPFDRDNDRREKENSSRKSQDAYVVEITRRRSRSKDVEEDRARTKDETKSGSIARPYEVLPGEFDVRIQRYERASIEGKRDQEYLKKNLRDPSKERETIRKISFSGDTDMPKRMHSKKDTGITRRTSFKDQDNEVRGRNPFKNDSDGGIKCTIKSRKSDVTEREKTELVDSADLGRRSSFKAKHPEYGKISFEEEEKEKRSSREHTRLSNARIISFGDDKIVGERRRTLDNQDRGIITSISFKDENSVESTTSPVRRVSKEPRENILGRRISFKDRGIESEREHSYGVYCDVGKDLNEEESRRRSSSFDDRFVESDRNFFTSRERGVPAGTSPWKDRNEIESRVRSSNGAMIKKISEEGTRDKKLERHSRAFTSERVDEDLKENFQETNDRKDSWREGNRLFAVRYLKENGRGRRTEGISGREKSGSLEDAYEEDEGDESEIEQEDSIRTNGRRISDNRDSDSKGRIARERNGTTIVRIRPNISENSRRRRRMQDFGLERRKRCDVSSQRYDSDEESGEEGEEDQGKQEEEDKKKVMPIVKDDEDADNEQRLDSWRGSRRDGLIPGIPHGSTPSRRLWNYREGGVLITDVEEGQPCLQCGDVCPGFSPHIWRKNCTSCKCPREDHDVCHEEWASVRSRLGLKADESNGLPGFSDPRERGLAWAPPGLPPHKVDEYFSMLPEISVPRLGTPGERLRDRQLAFQLPKQDLARAYCRYLDLKHASSADDFMAARNEIALDIGTVQEIVEEGSCCGACQEPLKYGSLAVSASKLGLLYHPACFRCADCKELLVDLAYCVHEDMIFCERHYAEQLKPRCSACDEVSMDIYIQYIYIYIHNSHNTINNSI
ncbi:nexilin isoform X1 [Vespula pensylvanica]|uniref:nexilin isoform X1 n=1 Tax=Vespula pensylvanica TaxID=30213 RepID=UPI001CBA19B6|nr:nexilin isoform X1 [Vespula pensylvanica]